MNTKNLKAYAPKARSQFIEAIKKRAAQFGIYQDKIAEVQFEGGAAIIEGRAFTKKQGDQRKRLEQRVEEKGFELFIREMAYTWFNRLAAIRYMELHDYLDHGFRVLSNQTNADSLPEILDHASDVVDSLDPEKKYLDKNHIIELQLAGNKEEELYRELLLGQCHRLYNIMPFMFEAIDDATELLLPDNLTKTDSILKGLINEIPEEDWNEIEVIGWLYQFYISEHKDAVIGKVVKSEDIPAATQLFTPNWIVKYLVQNSLGRQWLATYPESELKGKMEYYIEPAEQFDDVIEQLKAITPTSIDPEQIKVLDPAAGSGHILVEVYEVLREIYLERGYRLREIPELILTKNIYGLDIDDRAAQLAGFALMMKAREDDRRIFQRVEEGEVSLNVYSLQSTEGIDIVKAWQALNLEGSQQQGSTGGLFDGLDDESEGFVQPTGIYKDYFELLQMLKSAFLQAKTLGSLIQIDKQHLQNLVALKELLQVKEQGSDPSAKQAAINFLSIVNQSILLAQRYLVVVANPPYLSSKGMIPDLKSFALKKFPDSKSDLFGMFIENSLYLAIDCGYVSMITMQSWMFLGAYKDFRLKLFNENELVQMLHSGPGLFPELGDYNVLTTNFILQKGVVGNDYLSRVVKANESPSQIEKINKIKNYQSHLLVSLHKLKVIPDFPLTYWFKQSVIKSFKENDLIGDVCHPKQGVATGDNAFFVRSWYEIDHNAIAFEALSKEDVWSESKKFALYNKGGNYRKWYGNNEFVLRFYKEAYDELLGMGNHLPSRQLYFREGIVYQKFGFENFGVRYKTSGFVFDSSDASLFPDENLELILAFLCSNVAFYYLQAIAPTVNFQVGDISRLPLPNLPNLEKEKVTVLAKENIALCRSDWDSYETSWDFTTNPLVEITTDTLKEACYSFLKRHERAKNTLKKNEESINDIFIDSYDVRNEVVPDVIERDLSIKAESVEGIIKQLISHSLGCMMGRYSLDREGLVYAHSGNKGFKELSTEGAYQKFSADDDGIIPLASEDWLFDDDATARFKEFVKTVWGDDHLTENLEFVAESLCLHALKPVKDENANDTVRRYFSKQFYKDHCKTYKKRPIYWLFSSGKEKAFECLVYLHRYNEGTLSRMRTEYVTPLMGKYEAQHSLLAEQKLEATTTEARRIEKELKSLEKKQAELRTFDEQLKHYAEMRITLDLDDGVKANYGKFGNLLADVKAIHGKAVK
mgnify:CR=1 FL=1